MLYSGVFNFIGVLVGGTAVAFSIVHLLPVELLIRANTKGALAMTLSLLFAGVLWNLGTWYFGLPVSSSHTLIGSFLASAFCVRNSFHVVLRLRSGAGSMPCLSRMSAIVLRASLCPKFDNAP